MRFGDVTVGTVMVSQDTGDVYVCDRIQPATKHHVHIRWHHLVRHGELHDRYITSIYNNENTPKDRFFFA